MNKDKGTRRDLLSMERAFTFIADENVRGYLDGTFGFSLSNEGIPIRLAGAAMSELLIIKKYG